ncbi:hypothetical protein E2C01_018352 [Portunus trituberculatus]|uniref:Uncharacterized protein n=1 Tax=Portunus trituberculatus TaxID=210409 RepID=A0A5B7DVW7_PORTR|nr:hypothetical protein [Portunus trituberculatus]
MLSFDWLALNDRGRRVRQDGRRRGEGMEWSWSGQRVVGGTGCCPSPALCHSARPGLLVTLAASMQGPWCLCPARGDLQVRPQLMAQPRLAPRAGEEGGDPALHLDSWPLKRCPGRRRGPTRHTQQQTQRRCGCSALL